LSRIRIISESLHIKRHCFHNIRFYSLIWFSFISANSAHSMLGEKATDNVFWTLRYLVYFFSFYIIKLLIIVHLRENKDPFIRTLIRIFWIFTKKLGHALVMSLAMWGRNLWEQKLSAGIKTKHWLLHGTIRYSVCWDKLNSV
jgi:hypothetical protein